MYPGFPPNYKVVPKIGGYNRTCFVIEFRSLGPLTAAQVAMIREQLEGTTDKLRTKVALIENAVVATPQELDRIAAAGLRLPS